MDAAGVDAAGVGECSGVISMRLVGDQFGSSVTQPSDGVASTGSVRSVTDHWRTEARAPSQCSGGEGEAVCHGGSIADRTGSRESTDLGTPLVRALRAVATSLHGEGLEGGDPHAGDPHGESLDGVGLEGGGPQGEGPEGGHLEGGLAILAQALSRAREYALRLGRGEELLVSMQLQESMLTLLPPPPNGCCPLPPRCSLACHTTPLSLWSPLNAPS